MKPHVILLLSHHTWKRAFSNRVIYVLIAVICILLAYGLLTGWQNYNTQREIREKYTREAYEDFVNNPDKHPHRMAHYGHYAFRQPSPLSIFDRGLESFMGNSIYLEAHVQNTSNFSDAGLSTGLLRFGEISMAMVLQLLIPLFIFFIGFDAISKDRENGTLKILFGQGVNWKSLIVGRGLGLLSVVLAFLLPAFIIFLITVSLFLNVDSIFDTITRVGLLAFFYLVYFALCCLITVLISAGSKNSKSALVSLIGIWLVFGILLPRSVQSLGTLLYPVPSKTAFTKSLEEDILKEGDSHNPDDPHYTALKDSLLAAHNVDSVNQLPFNYGGFQIQEGERISAMIYNRHYEKLQQKYDDQNTLSRSLGLFDPFMAIKNLSMALSNSDYSTYVDFQKQAEEYRFMFVSRLNGFHMTDISNEAKNSAGKVHVSHHSRWSEIKAFEYQANGLRNTISSELVSLFAILVWLVALSIVVSSFTRKLSVV